MDISRQVKGERAAERSGALSDAGRDSSCVSDEDFAAFFEILGKEGLCEPSGAGVLLAGSSYAGTQRSLKNVPGTRDWVLGENHGLLARVGEGGQYELRVARRGEDRLACWHLVHSEYAKCGYAKPDEREYRYSVHDALPDTGTFQVAKDGRTIGTVTVYPDSPLGLPADAIYSRELAEFRATGRTPVEIGRLAIAEEHKNERWILTELFDVLSLYSRCLRGATDLVITVNPTHVKFYETMLLFERIGAQRELGSVCGAPAVLMRLDLELQRDVIRFEHGEGAKPGGYHGRRTFYRDFSTEGEERERVLRMRGACVPLPQDFLREYFLEEAPLLLHLSSPIRYFLEKCYPDLSLLPRAMVGEMRG